jgi:hypothetical protein
VVPQGTGLKYDVPEYPEKRKAFSQSPNIFIIIDTNQPLNTGMVAKKNLPHNSIIFSEVEPSPKGFFQSFPGIGHPPGSFEDWPGLYAGKDICADIDCFRPSGIVEEGDTVSRG